MRSSNDQMICSAFTVDPSPNFAPPLQRRCLTPIPSVSPSALTHDASKGSFHEGLLRPSRRSPSYSGVGWQLTENNDVEINKDLTARDVTDEVEIKQDSWLMKVVSDSFMDEEGKVVLDSWLMKVVPDSL